MADVVRVEDLELGRLAREPWARADQDERSAVGRESRDRAVQADDRFLLCSDGLTRTLTEEQIGSWLEKPIAAAVDGLIKDTLAAGAPDNVTVLIVEGYAEAV